MVVPASVYFSSCSTSVDTGLNAKLKAAGSTTTVVAFIIMPAATHGFTVEALKGQAVMKQLRDSVTDIQNEIGKKIFEAAARYYFWYKTFKAPTH